MQKCECVLVEPNNRRKVSNTIYKRIMKIPTCDLWLSMSPPLFLQMLLFYL